MAPSSLPRIERLEEGGIFPHLRIYSRLDTRRNVITLYRDAISEKSKKIGLPILTLESQAILHEYLHFIYPDQQRAIDIGIIPNADGC